MGRITVAGLVMAVSGALLVVALLLDWWDYPTAFDNPTALPHAARFLAEGVKATGEPLDADAFRFFEFRDILWLAAGISCFAFGLMVLATRRVVVPVAIGIGALTSLAAVLIALNLISPLEYADLVPDNGDAVNGDAVDLGIDLPLDPDVGGYIALTAAVAGVVGALLALVSSRAEPR